MRILAVDDDPIAVMILEAALADSGHEVVTAVNGRQGLETLRSGGLRLVISDWEMPEMNGPELCQAIRASDLPGYTYVIMLSAHDAPEVRARGLSAGADDFVTKPFDAEKLLACVQNAERFLALETRDAAVFAMAKLAENRDPQIGAHLERVRGYCRVLAQHLATIEKFRATVTAEYIRLIERTSTLHDIGKVGIPDAVLLKPGRLSDGEFAIMKDHAAIGARTLEAALKQVPGDAFLTMARDVALSHHEHFDGTGYPHQLKGEAIPLCGRIMALADVYDALTSRRVYKPAFTHDIARSMIVGASSTQFDPDVVDAFVKTERQFVAIHDRLAGAAAVAA